MHQQVLHTFPVYTIVYVFVFDGLSYVYGQGNQEMVDRGRIQYQLLKERSTLPHYGPCWRAAIEHLDEGCRHLSEDTQSDVALHITNCFLQMSGHETYNCELDRKPNLRAICINSMSDRAFNVYTEFYTHTHNICWFLQGQIWHETIAESTLNVGKQLEVTAQNQEDLLRAQKESLELQEKMLKHGKSLEQLLESLYVSSEAHREILQILSRSVLNLQAWVVGEVSWFNSIIFYVVAVFLTFVLTSTQRTLSARFPIFLLLFLNIVVERLICSLIISTNDGVRVHILYSNISDYVWYSRYSFTFLSMFLLIYCAFIHKDLNRKNNKLLVNIQEQNNNILNMLRSLKTTLYVGRDNLNMFSEHIRKKSSDNKQKNMKTEDENGLIYHSYDILDDKFGSYAVNLNTPNGYKDSLDISKENILNNSASGSPYKKRLFPLNEIQNRYNLRSRQGTPDSVNS